MNCVTNLGRLLIFICLFLKVNAHRRSILDLQLGEYNGWNMPFAKRVLVEPSNKDWDVDYDFCTSFPAKTHIVNIDPSAYFSVIWLDEEFLDNVPD